MDGDPQKERPRRRSAGRGLVQLEPRLAWPLYRRRRELRLSREQVAEMATRRLKERGSSEVVAADYLRRLEWGLVGWTSREKLEAVAGVLGVDLKRASADEGEGAFPGPAWRHPRDPFTRRVRMLRSVEEWLRRCSEQELTVLEEAWPVLATIASRLAALVPEEKGAAEPLSPEHVFEQNMGSAWRTPRDFYDWLEALLGLYEEVVPWRARVRRVREVLAGLEGPEQWEEEEEEAGEAGGAREEGEEG